MCLISLLAWTRHGPEPIVGLAEGTVGQRDVAKLELETLLVDLLRDDPGLQVQR